MYTHTHIYTLPPTLPLNEPAHTHTRRHTHRTGTHWHTHVYPPPECLYNCILFITPQRSFVCLVIINPTRHFVRKVLTFTTFPALYRKLKRKKDKLNKQGWRHTSSCQPVELFEVRSCLPSICDRLLSSSLPCALRAQPGREALPFDLRGEAGRGANKRDKILLGSAFCCAGLVRAWGVNSNRVWVAQNTCKPTE